MHASRSRSRLAPVSPLLLSGPGATQKGVRTMLRRILAILVLVLACTGPARAGGLPDLVLDLPTLAPRFDLVDVADDACELQPADRCVDAPGARKVLRFGVLAVNQGADLVVGVPRLGDPRWVYSECHGHFHFENFARYELRRLDGSTAVLGQKRAFCVTDSFPVQSATQRRYCCSSQCGDVQGLQHGWGDLYADTLPCQWLDVTDVPPGDYDVCVTLNFAGDLPESDSTNNEGCKRVQLSAPDPSRAPRVRLRAPRRHRRLRAGRRLRIAWQARVRGETLFQAIWFSPDGGATWRLVTDDVGARRRRYRWRVPADAVSDDARIKIVVAARTPADDAGAGALQTGEALSRRLRVVP
jgi:Lysyl oxidase